MARKKKFQLGDRDQKRGCATVAVPREDVLVNGRVPKGCRFHPERGNGTVLCTPKIAQKVGVLDIERKKPMPKAGQLTKRSYCYKPESPYPYRRDGDLKQGCEEDEETGKICCDRSYFRKSKVAAKTASRPKKKTAKKTASKKKTSKKAATKKKAPTKRAASKKTAKKTASKKKTSRKKTSRKRAQQDLFGVDNRFVFDSPPLADVEMAPVDALAPGVGMDAFELALATSTPLALLDDSGGDSALALGRSRASELLPGDIEMPEAHLQTFSDFAVTYAAGTVLVGAGLAATYELVDRMDYFDDKPVARAGAFVGVGAIPAALAWWLSQDSEYGPEIRTLAAGWGIAFTAIGGLGIIKTMLEKKAGETEDAEDRKSLEDAASHLPFPGRHRHDDDEEPEDADIVEDEEPDDEEPDEDDEIATDDGGEGDTPTAGVAGYGYPFNSFTR